MSGKLYKEGRRLSSEYDYFAQVVVGVENTAGFIR